MAKKKGHKKLTKKAYKTQSKKTSFWMQKRTIIAGLSLIAITIIAFYPSLHNEFVNWDDDRNFYKNQLIVDVTSGNFWQQIALIFQTPVIGNYNPLSNMTFAIEKLFFGFENPFYWHLDNLLLHLIAVLLVYRLGSLLKLDYRASFILALLFAIHPMRVESVAWVTERKDVLFGVFYFSALIFYVRNRIKANSKLVALTYFFFILALFSKIQAVSLPLSMLAIDYYMRRPLKRSVFIEKIPFFAISLAFGLLGIYFLQGEGSLDSTPQYSWAVRGLVGIYSYMIYIVKSIAPYQLVPMYPYPSGIPWYFYASIIYVPFFLYSLWYAYKKDYRPYVFGILFFTVNIMFLLQVLGAGQGFLADRFTYVPYFGLFFIYAYYGVKLYDKYGKKYKISFLFIGMLIGMAFSYQTHEQSKIWENSGTLWTHVLNNYSNTTLPYRNRGNYYRDRGEIKKALSDYSNNIRLAPNEDEAYNSRAKLYFNSNHSDTLKLALLDYNKAIEYNPNKGEYYANRGAIYARMGDVNRALNDLNKSVETSPDFSNGYRNRSIILSQLGRREEALNDMNSYLRLKPNDALIWFEGGKVHFEFGRYPEAKKYMNNAIRLNQSKGAYYHELAKIDFMLNQFAEAKQDIRMAQQLGFKVNPQLLQEINSKQ